MSGYQLTQVALDDLREIADYYLENASEQIARQRNDEFFSSFEKLAKDPGLGHRRSDFTSKRFHFYTTDPYYIVYRRDISPIQILGVLHTARNVKRILRSRH